MTAFNKYTAKTVPDEYQQINSSIALKTYLACCQLRNTRTTTLYGPINQINSTRRVIADFIGIKDEDEISVGISELVNLKLLTRQNELDPITKKTRLKLTMNHNNQNLKHTGVVIAEHFLHKLAKLTKQQIQVFLAFAYAAKTVKGKRVSQPKRAWVQEISHLDVQAVREAMRNLKKNGVLIRDPSDTRLDCDPSPYFPLYTSPYFYIKLVKPAALQDKEVKMALKAGASISIITDFDDLSPTA